MNEKLASFYKKTTSKSFYHRQLDAAIIRPKPIDWPRFC